MSEARSHSWSANRTYETNVSVQNRSERNRVDRENMIQECKNPIGEDDFHGFLHRDCEGTEQLQTNYDSGTMEFLLRLSKQCHVRETAGHLRSAPIALGCLAVPSAPARCCQASVANCQWQFGRFLCTHSRGLSVMIPKGYFFASHFLAQKSQSAGVPAVSRTTVSLTAELGSVLCRV